MKVLWLEKNALTTLPDEIFTSLPRLEQVRVLWCFSYYNKPHHAT